MTSPYKSCVNNLEICKANCCKNGVWVDVEQSKIITNFVNTDESMKDLRGKVLFSVETDDPDYFPSGKAIGTALASEEGPCIFLGKDYKCRVYPVRPYFCADYPLMHSMHTSKEPIMIDPMFESDPNCIYHPLLKATLKSMEEEAAEEKKS